MKDTQLITGKKRWAIAEGYIPNDDQNKDETHISHETICILNAGSQPADIELTLFFKDRDPIGPYKSTVNPFRTSHIRFNDLKDPQPVPRGTDFSSVLVSSVPVIAQHTRLDSRWGNNALLSTIAYGE